MHIISLKKPFLAQPALVEALLCLSKDGELLIFSTHRNGSCSRSIICHCLPGRSMRPFIFLSPCVFTCLGQMPRSYSQVVGQLIQKCGVMSFQHNSWAAAPALLFTITYLCLSVPCLLLLSIVGAVQCLVDGAPPVPHTLPSQPTSYSNHYLRPRSVQTSTHSVQV